jgi:hypothetical protein
MVSSGLLRCVAFVRTDVSEEPGASFIRVTKIGELGTTQAATSNRRTLRRNTKEAPGSSETSVLTRATRRNNPEHTILHSHRRENLKSYILLGIRSVRLLLVAASVVPSSQFLVTLIKGVLSSSETSVLTRATRRNIPEDTIIYSYRRENLKSYLVRIFLQNS